MQRHMTFPPETEALLVTREIGQPGHGGERRAGLPTDLVIQSVSRLRVIALLYAFVFFMVAMFPSFVVPQARLLMFSSFISWGPAVISIAVALFVAVLTRRPRIPLSSKLAIGLAFEMAGSYGIASAEFLDPGSLAGKPSGWTGLSWVAVWTVLFTIVVPTKPSRALAAALGSVSAVPVVIGSAMAAGTVSLRLASVEGANDWTDDRAREWWASHRPAPS